MRGVFMYGPGDVRVDEVPVPEPGPRDAVIRILRACICGSDLWPYRGDDPIADPQPMGHEYVGVVDAVGSDVTGVSVGETVVGSFVVSDYTHPETHYGNAKRGEQLSFMSGAQADYLLVPEADGMLVSVGFDPDDDQLNSLLAASDVFGTGWYGAIAANVREGSSVVVVGDGAVGQMAVLAARQQGAERVVMMSRHADRQRLAQEFGATDIVEERGEAGAAVVRTILGGEGADSVVEAVGREESFLQAIACTRPGGNMGFVGVPHLAIPGWELFRAGIHLTGGPAPVRRYLPHLITLIRERVVNPGQVFSVTLPLDEAARGYQLMDQRKAIKVALRPDQA